MRNSLWRGLFSVLLSVALTALAFCARDARADDAGDLSSVRARGELVWAGDLQGGEPYVFEDPKDASKVIGFEVDIANAIARRLGVRARFFQNQWSNLVPSLERSDFDVILNGLESTPERQERMLLSRPYFVYGLTITVRKGSEARTLADLRGKRIGTLNQTVAYDTLLKSPVEAVVYEGQQEPYADLVSERVDAVLLDHIIAQRYGCVLPQLSCVQDDVARGVYVIGLRKGDSALKAAIDEALDAMIADGELRRILETWSLWDHRQTELAAREKEREKETAPPPPSMSGEQVLLFLQGASVTLGVSFASFAIALPLGILLAIMRLYGGPVGRVVSATYVEIFRGTPALLQLYFLYYGLAPIIKLGPLTAAIVGLGLNYAAYEAEVHRGALVSIPRGQSEAARALGLSGRQILQHVLLPQSLRNALPAVTNDFVALLKDSSLVSVITVVELTKRMSITSVEIRSWVLPGLLCAALYLAMSVPLARLARRLEHRLAR